MQKLKHHLRKQKVANTPFPYVNAVTKAEKLRDAKFLMIDLFS